MQFYRATILIPKPSWGGFRFKTRILLGFMTFVCIALGAIIWWSPASQVAPGIVPILGPITTGDVMSLDPPSDDEVLRALDSAIPIKRGFRFSMARRKKENVRIIKEKTADYVDPVRVYPLVGAAQQHHAHYKCTVYFGGGSRDVQYVVQVDHNHLHVVDTAQKD